MKEILHGVRVSSDLKSESLIFLFFLKKSLAYGFKISFSSFMKN